ncbi:MAG: hypothetical protein KGJ86_17840 [Chloroflexota bacterium]|nr:hypothetical protein [Chloroflexota bacterium]
MATVMIVLRLFHIVAAAAFLGSIMFNFLIVRRSYGLIPPAHAVVIGQRIGTEFNYLGWASLGTLVVTGVLRLLVDGRLPMLATLDFYGGGAGRAIGLMIAAWVASVLTAGAMTIFLRPVLMSKLKVESNPGLSDVAKRRSAQTDANQWMTRLQVVSLVAALLAVIGGASAMYGGLF